MQKKVIWQLLKHAVGPLPCGIVHGCPPFHRPWQQMQVVGLPGTAFHVDRQAGGTTSKVVAFSSPWATTLLASWNHGISSLIKWNATNRLFLPFADYVVCNKGFLKKNAKREIEGESARDNTKRAIRLEITRKVLMSYFLPTFPTISVLKYILLQLQSLQFSKGIQSAKKY